MKDAIGAGLIAAGAVALVLSFLLPDPIFDPVKFSMAEQTRRWRNIRTVTLVSALATLAGSVVLLISTDWLWSLLGVGIVALGLWLVLAARTHHDYKDAERILRRNDLSDNLPSSSRRATASGSHSGGRTIRRPGASP